MSRRPTSPEDRPFAAAAAYYRFRAHYAPEALDWLAAALGVDRTSRILDLGCGPGTLAIPLAGRAGEVVALDREAAMLAEGRRQTGVAGRGNIRWLHAAAESVSPRLGRFQAAVMGQSLHWMDRDAVLETLALMIEDGGGVAMVNPGRRRPQESWEPTAFEVVARFLGPTERHPLANPEPENEPAFRRSRCFSALETRTFGGRIERDPATILGCLYSLSYAARPRFGDRAAAFEADLFAALARLNPAGRFAETIETDVTIARKGP